MPELRQIRAWLEDEETATWIHFRFTPKLPRSQAKPTCSFLLPLFCLWDLGPQHSSSVTCLSPPCSLCVKCSSPIFPWARQTPFYHRDRDTFCLLRGPLPSLASFPSQAPPGDQWLLPRRVGKREVMNPRQVDILVRESFNTVHFFFIVLMILSITLFFVLFICYMSSQVESNLPED